MNSTHEFGEFSITIVNEKIEKEDETSKRRNLGQKKPGIKTKNTNKQPNKDNILNILPPFFCAKDKIRLKKGESSPLTVIFMPFFMETYRCKLVFSDKDVGEFQYEIIGETLLPEILAEIRPNSALTIHVDTHTHYEHPIPFRNDQMLAAKKIHENRLMTSGKLKEGLNKFKQQMLPPDEMLYTLEMQPSNSNVSIPGTFKLMDPSKIPFKAKNEKNAAESTFIIKKTS